jgi:hypothetical protein
MVWATFWAIFSKAHPVTLTLRYFIPYAEGHNCKLTISKIFFPQIPAETVSSIRTPDVGTETRH